MSWGKTDDPSGPNKAATVVVALPDEIMAVASKLEIKRELDRIRESALEAFESRRRFWFYPMLNDVYAFFAKWKKVRRSKKCAKIAARLFGVDLGNDPLRVFIDAVAPDRVNNKTRTRWAVGLCNVWKQGVSPRDIDDFFKANGGIAGCARRF